MLASPGGKAVKSNTRMPENGSGVVCLLITGSHSPEDSRSLARLALLPLPPA